MAAARLVEALRAVPCGAALKGGDRLEAALRGRARVLFVLRGDGLEMAAMVRRIHEAGKLAVVHVDLVAGTGHDGAGVRWLVRAGVDGLISSHGHLVRTAKAAGVAAIQRLLLTDEASLAAGLAAVARAGPDLVEVLPGAVLPELADLLIPRLDVPVLAGGFITSRDAAKKALDAGALAVTTSTEELWR